MAFHRQLAAVVDVTLQGVRPGSSQERRRNRSATRSSRHGGATAGRPGGGPGWTTTHDATTCPRSRPSRRPCGEQDGMPRARRLPACLHEHSSRCSVRSISEKHDSQRIEVPRGTTELRTHGEARRTRPAPRRPIVAQQRTLEVPSGWGARRAGESSSTERPKRKVEALATGMQGRTFPP